MGARLEKTIGITNLVLVLVFDFYFGLISSGIDYMDGELKVFPISTRYQTHVNGELIKKTTRLRNGDRLVIGETHFLQVSNPKDSTEFVEVLLLNLIYIGGLIKNNSIFIRWITMMPVKN